MPAAAVKREGLVLFRLTGRKVYVGGKLTNDLNLRFIFKGIIKFIFLSVWEDYRILSVMVKYVEIWRNF